MCVENAKALLETIGKEICKSKGKPLGKSPSMNSVLKNAFSAMGYTNSDMITQISSALGAIGQKLGSLRNDVGSSSHGRSLEDLKKRNDIVNETTKLFLIDSVDLVACFLIGLFEGEHIESSSVEEVEYSACEDFNAYWDDQYGEFSMGDYSYTASEILYSVDPQAYKSEYSSYLNGGEETLAY